MISVVIPLFNKRDTVSESVASVLNQTASDFELIIVNDGSTDGVEDVLCNISDPRVRIFHTNNRGVSSARNFGIAKARFEYVAFLDADDQWEADYIFRLKKLIEMCPDAILYCGRYQIETFGTRRLGSYSLSPDHFGYVRDFFETYRNSKSLVCSSSACVRKRGILLIGGFPEDKSVGEDVSTWLSLGLAGRVASDGKVCATVNVNDHRVAARSNEVPHFIEKYLPPHLNVRGEESQALTDFITYYSLVYSAEAVRNNNRRMAMTYARMWIFKDIRTAITCALFALSPIFIIDWLRAAAHGVARLRSERSSR